jgi:hypothetical protein
MAETVAQQLARLQLEIQNLHAQLHSKTQATKDLCMVTLINKWSGTDKSQPVNDFFDSIEASARVGNWSDTDKKEVCILKLTEAAKAFYAATSELRNPSISWDSFKALFHRRFKDSRSDQFHFLQLQTAKQGRSESPKEFADRIRSLALLTIPHTDDPVTQRIYAEQAERMLLASYTAGLTGTPGLQVRYRMPTTLEEAVQIATSVGQAESQERAGGAVFLEAPPGRQPQVSKPSESARLRGGRIRSNRNHPKPRKQQSPNKADRTAEKPRCFECRGLGHYARECPSRRRRLESRSNHRPSVFSESPRNAQKRDASRKNGRDQGN